MPPLSSEQLKHLSSGLLENPYSNMNNIVPLMTALNPRQPKESSISAVRGLKVFFSDASEKGDLGAVIDQAGELKDPHTYYLKWLSRQYTAFIPQIIKLIEDGAQPEVQVAAVAALMEGVRGYADSGKFNIALYGRVVEALLGTNASADALSYLITAFLPYSDVRFYTLRSVAKLAENSASGMPTTKEDTEDMETALAQRLLLGKIAPPSHKVAALDLARSAYDVLANIHPEAEVDAQRSWSGADAAAAKGQSENAQKRRKRKRLEGEEGTVNGGNGAKPVKWASHVLQRRAWSKAWLSLLRLPLPQDILKKVLVKMHGDIMPHLTNPHLLTDFLSATLDTGGLHGILALHGIFTLVTKHGLEYPYFYRRLYNLLTPAALMAKQRVRFFQLADVFLSSGMVPAYTAAAFAKRFARLALMSSPAGAMIAIAFVHNLLRRHPSCNVLLHKPQSPAAAPTATSAAQAASGATASVNGTAEAGPQNGHANRGSESAPNGQPDASMQRVSSALERESGQDPYEFAEEDPAESRAIESSLWELDSLRNHYCPQVAAFAAVLDKDLTDRRKTAEVDLGPLLTGSYSSLVNTELARRLKQVPVAFYPVKLTGLIGAEKCGADFVGWAL